MKKTFFKQFPGWIAFFALLLNISALTDARGFQVDTSMDYSESVRKTPTIKIEEYHYLEEKLLKNNSEYSIIDLLFGDGEKKSSIASNSHSISRTNRILLPKMVGGLPALFANIEYPNQAKANGIEGIVEVEFTVNELGMVENINIINGIGGGCDEEVVRALKKTRFSPAIQNGRFVKVKLSQSILFELKSLK